MIKDHHFVVLGLDGARKGGKLAIGHIVADALDIGESAILLPDVSGSAGHLLIGFHIVLRNSDNKSIDIGHFGSPPHFTIDGKWRSTRPRQPAGVEKRRQCFVELAPARSS